MTGDVEVDYERDCLTLRCGEETFSRLRDLLIAEAGVTGAIDGPVDGITFVNITIDKAYAPESRLGVRVRMLGCGAVACGILIVFYIGVLTIVRWLR